jgi:hypothetical protein
MENPKGNETKGLSQKDYDHIDLILKEAESHGLKWEVEAWAKKYIGKYPHIDLVTAYHLGYKEWVK